MSEDCNDFGMRISAQLLNVQFLYFSIPGPHVVGSAAREPSAIISRTAMPQSSGTAMEGTMAQPWKQTSRLWLKSESEVVSGIEKAEETINRDCNMRATL